jgi:hypothetical protein
MAFYLAGKIRVGTNELPPKEATQMSHDVKYIGMDGLHHQLPAATQNGDDNRFLVYQSVIDDLENGSSRLDRGVSTSIENAPHVAVTFSGSGGSEILPRSLRLRGMLPPRKRAACLKEMSLL